MLVRPKMYDMKFCIGQSTRSRKHCDRTRAASRRNAAFVEGRSVAWNRRTAVARPSADIRISLRAYKSGLRKGRISFTKTMSPIRRPTTHLSTNSLTSVHAYVGD